MWGMVGVNTGYVPSLGGGKGKSSMGCFYTGGKRVSETRGEDAPSDRG